MRDFLENPPREDPIAAARRDAARPALRRRFYEKATAAREPGGYGVLLDGTPALTPLRHQLVAPTLAIAEAIAAEWQAQETVIDPGKMPLTRLANTVIDCVTGAAPAVAADIRKYLASDLLFYRAASPEELRERQARLWDPVLARARQELGADFKIGEGVMHVRQPDDALAAAGDAIPEDPWRLGALHIVTTLTGSALLALALSRGRLTPDEAWLAAHVDEDWNMEKWGREETAVQRRASRFKEFQAAAMVLNALA
jgi:chaperone required for assembly of F1-ATPase